MIAFMSFMIFCSLLFGLIGYFSANVGMLKELSIGIIVLGLGMLGLLKASVEMFENHRKHKILVIPTNRGKIQENIYLFSQKHRIPVFIPRVLKSHCISYWIRKHNKKSGAP